VARSWQARADGYQVPPTYGNADGNHDLRAGEVSFANFLFLPSWFAKLLEAIFLVLSKSDGCQVGLPNYCSCLALLLLELRILRGNEN
jgi:hypothetical protein